MLKKAVFIIYLTALIASSCHAQLTTGATTESIAPESRPYMMEMYRIRVANVKGGTIEVSSNKGGSWTFVGKVALPADRVNDQGYTASRWIDDGEIAATAVNAIHVKTDFNYKDDRGIIFNIEPKEYYPGPAATPEASIFTDIKAGNSIFGGGYSPIVGNVVSISDVFGNLSPIKTGYVPKIGDTIVIVVERPARYPKEIIFENRFGGLITIKYVDGEKRYVGQVLRPVEGIGRFIGSEYADVGRLRANHAGVICVSTSPLGWVGGFQIIPSGHGMSKEMITARTLTQWMVIGPVSALDPSFEGLPPFFKYYLQPRYNEDDIEKPDWKKRLLERFLVEVKYSGSNEWKVMPAYYVQKGAALPKWANTAMEGVSEIRILFPIYEKQ